MIYDGAFVAGCFSRQPELFRVVLSLVIPHPVSLSFLFFTIASTLRTSLRRVFRKLGGTSFITDQVLWVIMYINVPLHTRTESGTPRSAAEVRKRSLALKNDSQTAK